MIWWYGICFPVIYGLNSENYQLTILIFKRISIRGQQEKREKNINFHFNYKFK